MEATQAVWETHAHACSRGENLIRYPRCLVDRSEKMCQPLATNHDELIFCRRLPPRGHCCLPPFTLQTQKWAQDDVRRTLESHVTIGRRKEKETRFLQILDAQRPVAPYRGTPKKEPPCQYVNSHHATSDQPNLFVQVSWCDKCATGHLFRIESESDTSWVVLALWNGACLTQPPISPPPCV